ncbi:MAG: M20/M25/M40 family metallo-hydrolase [Akkermansiaceae bacterium]
MRVKTPTIIILAAVVIGVFLTYLDFSNPVDYHGRIAHAHTRGILACGPRPPESEGLKKAQKYISHELAKHGWSTMTQSIERDTPLGKKTFVNLIARFNAENIESLQDLQKLPTKGILGAHLDSKLIPGIPDFLGADDAASACALIIELAAQLSKNQPDLARELEIVFFDGEEAFGENMTASDGLYGSRAYALTLYDRKPKPEFGIVLDMIGHKNLQIAVPADTDRRLYQIMLDAAKEEGYGKHYGLASGRIMDDHLYLNKAGVPTIDIIGADFNHTHWWHQADDNIELISEESLTISYHVTMNMLLKLLSN